MPAGARRRAAGLAAAAALVTVLAGLPAGLYAIAGPPVPRAVPAWHTIAAALTRPDDGTLLVAAIRWISWLAWAISAASILAECCRRARGRPAPPAPGAGPLRRGTAALVSTAMLSLVPVLHLPRPGPARPGPPQVPAAAGTMPGPAVRQSGRAGEAGQGGSGAPAGRAGHYRVIAGDNLWDIAARHLGDGTRWREIFRLNRGRAQPDGRSLTDPDLIYPGWILQLPAARHSGRPRPAPHRTPPPRGLPAPPVRPAPPRMPTPFRTPVRTGRPVCPPGHPARAGSPHRHQPGAAGSRRPARAAAGHQGRPAGIELPGGYLAGLALAALISTALISWRLHRRRTAVPGWPASASQPEEHLPPAVSWLRRAHLRSIAAGAAQDRDGPQPGHSPAADPAVAPPAGTVTFGRRSGTEIPLAAVSRGGLGLTGPGADAAARALLTGSLPARPGREHPCVFIPEADLLRLTGGCGPGQIPGVTPGLPDGLTVTGSLAGALDRLETEITRRLRRLSEDETPGDVDLLVPDDQERATITVIASVPPASAPRVQAVLAAGAPAGVTAVILGDWPAGTTCRISATGIVLSATDPALAGTETFRLSPGDTAAMLSLLRGAQGHIGHQPGAPAPSPAWHPAPAPPGPPASHGTSQGTRPDTSVASRMPALPQDRTPAAPAPAAQEPAAAPAAGSAAPASAAGLSVSAPAAGRAAPPGAADPAPARPAEITVLGVPRITVRGTEIRGGLRKARELLAYLAVHPRGATGGAISEALWPGSDPGYSARQRHLALRKARGMLRAAAGQPAPMFILLAGDRYRLDPAHISTDLWRFDAALEQAAAAPAPAAQLAALRQAADLYHGPVGEDTTWDWAERYAEPARRRALDALTRIAELLGDQDPEQALRALETALTHDPYNEALHHKIIAIQVRLGRTDAAQRTRTLLHARLAELGIPPDRGTPGTGRSQTRPR